MSGFSTLYDNKILSALFKNVPVPAIDMHWALFHAEDGLTESDAATWDEVTGAGYTRVKVTPSSFTEPANSMVENTDFIEFPVATGDWGTVTHVALMDASTSGNVVFWGLIRDPLTLTPRPRTIVTSDQYIMRPGTAVVRIIDSTMV